MKNKYLLQSLLFILFNCFFSNISAQSIKNDGKSSKEDLLKDIFSKINKESSIENIVIDKDYCIEISYKGNNKIASSVKIQLVTRRIPFRITTQNSFEAGHEPLQLINNLKKQCSLSLLGIPIKVENEYVILPDAFKNHIQDIKVEFQNKYAYDFNYVKDTINLMVNFPCYDLTITTKDIDINNLSIQEANNNQKATIKNGKCKLYNDTKYIYTLNVLYYEPQIDTIEKNRKILDIDANKISLKPKEVKVELHYKYLENSSIKPDVKEKYNFYLDNQTQNEIFTYKKICEERVSMPLENEYFKAASGNPMYWINCNDLGKIKNGKIIEVISVSRKTEEQNFSIAFDNDISDLLRAENINIKQVFINQKPLISANSKINSFVFSLSVPTGNYKTFSDKPEVTITKPYGYDIFWQGNSKGSNPSLEEIIVFKPESLKKDNKATLTIREMPSYDIIYIDISNGAKKASLNAIKLHYDKSQYKKNYIYFSNGDNPIIDVYEYDKVKELITGKNVTITPFLLKDAASIVKDEQVTEKTKQRQFIHIYMFISHKLFENGFEQFYNEYIIPKSGMYKVFLHITDGEKTTEKEYKFVKYI